MLFFPLSPQSNLPSFLWLSCSQLDPPVMSCVLQIGQRTKEKEKTNRDGFISALWKARKDRKMQLHRPCLHYTVWSTQVTLAYHHQSPCTAQGHAHLTGCTRHCTYSSGVLAVIFMCRAVHRRQVLKCGLHHHLAQCLLGHFCCVLYVMYIYKYGWVFASYAFCNVCCERIYSSFPEIELDCVQNSS